MEEIHHKNSSVFGGFFFCGTEKKDARVEKYTFGKKKGGNERHSIGDGSIGKRPPGGQPYPTPTPSEKQKRENRNDKNQVKRKPSMNSSMSTSHQGIPPPSSPLFIFAFPLFIPFPVTSQFDFPPVWCWVVFATLGQNDCLSSSSRFNLHSNRKSKKGNWKHKNPP